MHRKLASSVNTAHLHLPSGPQAAPAHLTLPSPVATPTAGLSPGPRPLQGLLLSSADAALPASCGPRPPVSPRLSLHPDSLLPSSHALGRRDVPTLVLRLTPGNRPSSPATSARDARRPQPQPEPRSRGPTRLSSHRAGRRTCLLGDARPKALSSRHRDFARRRAGGVEGGWRRPEAGPPAPRAPRAPPLSPEGCWEL